MLGVAACGVRDALAGRFQHRRLFRRVILPRGHAKGVVAWFQHVVAGVGDHLAHRTLAVVPARFRAHAERVQQHRIEEFLFASEPVEFVRHLVCDRERHHLHRRSIGRKTRGVVLDRVHRVADHHPQREWRFVERHRQHRADPVLLHLLHVPQPHQGTAHAPFELDRAEVHLRPRKHGVDLAQADTAVRCDHQDAASTTLCERRCAAFPALLLLTRPHVGHASGLA